jgi:hypothetical protein
MIERYRCMHMLDARFLNKRCHLGDLPACGWDCARLHRYTGHWRPVKGGLFLDHLSNCQLLTKAFVSIEEMNQ